ncbi:SapC family protein [Sphingomonas sp. I4]
MPPPAPPDICTGRGHGMDARGPTIMADMELLDSARHGALRVSAAPDATRHFVQLVAGEFLAAALHYPILFARHPETGTCIPAR